VGLCLFASLEGPIRFDSARKYFVLRGRFSASERTIGNAKRPLGVQETLEKGVVAACSLASDGNPVRFLPGRVPAHGPALLEAPSEAWI
jgi:hypothetical protein